MQDITLIVVIISLSVLAVILMLLVFLNYHFNDKMKYEKEIKLAELKKLEKRFFSRGKKDI